MTGALFAASDSIMAAHSDRSPADRSGTRLLTLLVFLAWGAALTERLWAARQLPLWIDETWTAMIASQSGWVDFWREAWLDVNPPLYYALMALWTRLAGLSDVALRLPSAAFVIAAAALPLIWRGEGLTRNSRLCWSTLLILWWPGFEISLDARGYGLLMLLSVAQALAFASLLAHPGRRTACCWAALAAASILTHYFALVPAALQGMAFLMRERRRALSLWPAALVFVPAFAWLTLHAPRLAEYARPDVAWYEPVTAKLFAGFIQYLVGPPGWLQWGLIGGAITITVAASRGRRARPLPGTTALEKTAIYGAVALAIVISMGFLRATLTDRYLVPLVPLILLACVMLVQRFEKAVWGQALLVLAFLAPVMAPADLHNRLRARNAYGFEQASAFLLPFRPARLTFVWDHPAAQVLDPKSLEKLGRFFLVRAGQNPVTRSVVLKPEQDGNVMLSAANTDAVIWIYNRARNTSARAHRPDSRRWPGRMCEHRREPWVGILACAPVAKAGSPAKVAP